MLGIKVGVPLRDGPVEGAGEGQVLHVTWHTSRAGPLPPPDLIFLQMELITFLRFNLASQ